MRPTTESLEDRLLCSAAPAANISAVATGIFASPEAQSRPAPTVQALYEGLLNREPSADEAAYWSAFTAAGQVGGIAGSAEFSQLHPEAGGELSALYGTLLGREPDQAGEAFWGATLGYVPPVVTPSLPVVPPGQAGYVTLDPVGVQQLRDRWAYYAANPDALMADTIAQVRYDPVPLAFVAVGSPPG